MGCQRVGDRRLIQKWCPGWGSDRSGGGQTLHGGCEVARKALRGVGNQLAGRGFAVPSIRTPPNPSNRPSGRTQHALASARPDRTAGRLLALPQNNHSLTGINGTAAKTLQSFLPASGADLPIDSTYCLPMAYHTHVKVRAKGAVSHFCFPGVTARGML